MRASEGAEQKLRGRLVLADMYSRPTPPFTDHMTQLHAAPSQTHGRSSRSEKAMHCRMRVATESHPSHPTKAQPKASPSTPAICRVLRMACVCVTVCANWGSPSKSSPSSPSSTSSPAQWKIQSPRKQKVTHLHCVGPLEPDRKKTYHSQQDYPA